MDPPRHAVVLSLDEKSQIQALERTRPSRPVTPGRPETHTHDYIRHGTTTLLAALDVLEGTVIGRCMQRHRHEEFLRFLKTIEAAVPAGKLIHVILDNYGTHKHPEGASLAGPASALDLPLHADLGLVDERGRGLLLRPDPAQAENVAASAGSSTFRLRSTATSPSTTTGQSPSSGPSQPPPS